MTAEQLRRAADALSGVGPVVGVDTEGDDAVAALLRAAADGGDIGDGDPAWSHHTLRASCRQAAPKTYFDRPCPRCLADDVAAAYLGEEPQS